MMVISSEWTNEQQNETANSRLRLNDKRFMVVVRAVRCLSAIFLLDSDASIRELGKLIGDAETTPPVSRSWSWCKIDTTHTLAQQLPLALLSANGGRKHCIVTADLALVAQRPASALRHLFRYSD